MSERDKDASALVRRDDSNLVESYLAGLGDNAARTMRSALRAGAQVLTGDDGADEHVWNRPGTFNARNVDRVVRELLKLKRTPTARNTRAALRGMARHFFTAMSDTPHAEAATTLRRAIDDVKVKGLNSDSGRRRGRAWSRREVAKLMHCCQRAGTAVGARDAALVACLFGAALRRFEVAALNLADYHPRTNERPALLRVEHGKGDKADDAALPPDAAAAIKAWIKVRGREPGPLFWRMSRQGVPLAGKRLSADGVYFAVRLRALQAGLEYQGTHDGRRTVATHMLDGGEPITIVRDALRHAEISTTARYVRHEKDKALAALARTITVGYETE